MFQFYQHSINDHNFQIVTNLMHKSSTLLYFLFQFCDGRQMAFVLSYVHSTKQFAMDIFYSFSVNIVDY